MSSALLAALILEGKASLEEPLSAWCLGELGEPQRAEECLGVDRCVGIGVLGGRAGSPAVCVTRLSPEEATARSVGGRRGKPVILRIDARAMREAGHVFFVSPNDVWLTDAVPSSFIWGWGDE